VESFLHDMSWVLPLRSETATVIANIFTALGYAPFFLAALPLVYWIWDKHVGARLALLVILTAVVNGFLKDVFDDPRPPIEYAVDPRVGNSYGLPSGHAQIAIAMWLWLAIELKQRWFWPVAIFIAFGVCFSRLYLGVHDIEDVLVGAALGLACIGIFRFFLSDTFAGWRALHLMVQLVVIALGQAALWFLWPEPDGPGGTFAIGGMLVGWWVGIHIDQRHIHFGPHPNIARRIAAAVAGLAVIFLALVRIAPALADIGLHPIAANWLQSMLIALFVTAAAPWIFQRVGLAVRSRDRAAT
jgi:membrane-associated phospholipid phosphatase